MAWSALHISLLVLNQLVSFLQCMFKGPIALAVGGVCLVNSSLVYLFFISLSLSGRRPDLDRNIVSKGR